jgi:hypothetical protein
VPSRISRGCRSVDHWWRRSSPASKAPNEITGYVAAGVVPHFDLYRFVVGRRQH